MSLEEKVKRLAELESGFPESWIPSPDGDTLVGEFVRIEQGATVRGPAWVAVFRTEDKVERSVWLLHTVLRNELVRQRPRPGELVVIRYEGTKLTRAGQLYHAYRVLVDREELPPDWDAVAGAATEDSGESSDEDGEEPA
jgi:hypothetical protein